MPVKVLAASVLAIVALVPGNVIVVPSVPSKVRFLLKVSVLPSTPARVRLLLKVSVFPATPVRV
jgi:hypothetical protein